MTTFLILLLLVLVANLAALHRVVDRDGLGTRQPPRSRREWWEGAHGV